jgi:magnesium-transporting ATPase (P-type)
MRYIDVEVRGVLRRYDILQTLEFTSERKKMSIILRDVERGTIRIYTKGADDKLSNCIDRSNVDYASVQQVLEIFAGSGLRTLVCGYRDISPEQYDAWLPFYQQASTELHGRASAIERASDMIEKDLKLIAVTAIEDKLQVRSLVCV